MTNEAKLAILAIAEAFLESVKVAGDHGAPAGVLYSAVLDKLSLQQFESVMSGLVALGCVTKSGHLYHFVKDLPRKA